jgi:hypothetical protein
MTDNELIEIVRKNGGIVHKDGNIFMTNTTILKEVIAEVLEWAINDRNEDAKKMKCYNQHSQKE